MTGVSRWKSGEQGLLFANIRLVGISASQGSLFFGIRVLDPGALDALRKYGDIRDFSVFANDTILRVPALDADPVPDAGLERVVPHLQYWREFF
jgi:hypothetical protein